MSKLDNKKILIVDFDQQANATITLGIKREEVQREFLILHGIPRA